MDASEWDRINRGVLVCDEGRILVAGCADYFPNANRIEVAPGANDVFVAYRNLESLSADGLEGDDSFRIVWRLNEMELNESLVASGTGEAPLLAAELWR